MIKQENKGKIKKTKVANKNAPLPLPNDKFDLVVLACFTQRNYAIKSCPHLRHIPMKTAPRTRDFAGKSASCVGKTRQNEQVPPSQQKKKTLTKFVKIPYSKKKKYYCLLRNEALGRTWCRGAGWSIYIYTSVEEVLNCNSRGAHGGQDLKARGNASTL